MKKMFLALAVLAVGLPSIALAGEPVPMTDDDLDSVAAGASLSALLKLDTQQVLSNPQYAQRSSAAVAKYNSLTDAQKAQVATKVSTLYSRLNETDRSKIWAITPKELQGLLRTQN